MIYKDSDHQEKLEIEEALKNSPSERIVQVVELIKKIYPVLKPVTEKRIHFLI